MAYTITTTPIDGVLVLEPKVFGDARGFFFESFNARDFAQATGLKETFVQDNIIEFHGVNRNAISDDNHVVIGLKSVNQVK